MPRIEDEIKLDFADVLIRPKRSTIKSRSEVDITRSFIFRNKKEWTGVPIFAANMDTTGRFELAVKLAEHMCMTACHKFYTAEDYAGFASAHPETMPWVSASAGVSKADFANLTSILDAVPAINWITLDVANGYSEFFADTVRRTRESFPRHIIAAGNVVTAEMTEELLLCGADVVKIGIGPGSVCTTRRQTGVGYPQLSALLECADAAHGLGGHIISDGGCTCPGDVAKAFGTGADFVMLGGMFAGHDESGGDVVVRADGSLYKSFYGMSSSVAMARYAGGTAEYRSSEGKAVEVPYRGSVESTLLSILGGLRSTCTYVGASKLKELSKRTTFIRVNAQLNESLKAFDVPQSHGYTRLATGLTSPTALESAPIVPGPAAGSASSS